MSLDLIQCPEEGCTMPAEVKDRYTLYSTDGPVEHVRTLCINRHVFNMPLGLGDD